MSIGCIKTLEKYLTVVDFDFFRRALCKLRVSDHDLRIESGRFENLTRNERICQLCDLQLVEDEFHFCLICQAYTKIFERNF